MTPSASKNGEMLGRIALRMARSLELDDVLDEITRGFVEEYGAALARIWLVKPEARDTLTLVSSAGLSERVDGAHAKVKIGALKIGEIARSREPVCVSDLGADDRFADKEWIATNELQTFAGYPLVFENDLLGVVAMFSQRPLDRADFEALGVFAAQAAVAVKNARLFAEVSELTRRLQAENAYLKEEIASGIGIVGESEPLQRALREVERVAPTSANVLLLGETGTGKELFARAVHRLSPRRDGPLIKVSAASLAPTLIESELFGHEKGAFTGAVQRRIGRFELARGGTLFLDEIGELPLEVQAKLLRVLQEREIERVGGTHPIKVDARIIAATNRDLEAEVKVGRFRSDLFFRLNVFPIRIPALRERRDDIPRIARALVRTPFEIDEPALEYLQSYDWPGNVRELENVLERAMVLAKDGRITLAELPELRSPVVAPPPSTTSSAPLKDRVDAYERTLIEDALAQANGNQSEAARLLGTSRTALQYKMKIFKLK